MLNGAKLKLKVDFDKGEDCREIPTRDILESLRPTDMRSEVTLMQCMYSDVISLQYTRSNVI